MHGPLETVGFVLPLTEAADSARVLSRSLCDRFGSSDCSVKRASYSYPVALIARSARFGMVFMMEEAEEAYRLDGVMQ